MAGGSPGTLWRWADGHGPRALTAPGPSVRRPPLAVPRDREQTRARYPDLEGFAERDGGRIGYEVYGTGDPPLMFVPPWIIVHSRIWKAQIPRFRTAPSGHRLGRARQRTIGSTNGPGGAR